MRPSGGDLKPVQRRLSLMIPTHMAQRNDTTVGHVEVPHPGFSPDQYPSLAGTLTCTSGTQANSGRRRLYGPTLLQSPSRRGHSSKMEEIFCNARASLSTPTIRLDSPTRSIRQLYMDPRPVSVMKKAPEDTVPAYQMLDEGPCCPACRRHASRTATNLESDIIQLHQGSGTCGQAYEFTRMHAHLFGTDELSPLARLSPAPGTPGHSYFTRAPQIACAQIVAMNEIETLQKPSNLSSSSASWTGDSQFYRPQHKFLTITPQDRKSSIPEWLDKLPVEPDEFERDTWSDQDMVPLSPDVEVERGSMRRKLRRAGKRKRRLVVGHDGVGHNSH